MCIEGTLVTASSLPSLSTKKPQAFLPHLGRTVYRLQCCSLGLRAAVEWREKGCLSTPPSLPLGPGPQIPHEKPLRADLPGAIQTVCVWWEEGLVWRGLCMDAQLHPTSGPAPHICQSSPHLALLPTGRGVCCARQLLWPGLTPVTPTCLSFPASKRSIWHREPDWAKWVQG